MKSFYMIMLVLTHSICAMDQQNIPNTHPLDPHNPIAMLLYAATIVKRSDELNEKALEHWQQLQQAQLQDNSSEVFIQNVQETPKEVTDTTDEK